MAEHTHIFFHFLLSCAWLLHDVRASIDDEDRLAVHANDGEGLPPKRRRPPSQRGQRPAPGILLDAKGAL